MPENNQLIEWTRRHRTSQALALRSRIILACAQKLANGEVARRVRTTPQTVGKWRRRFVQRRLDGLLDEPRPGTPRGIGDAQIKRGTHRSTIELEQAIRKYLAIHNEKPQSFVWTKTADDILASPARFCKRISDSGH